MSLASSAAAQRGASATDTAADLAAGKKIFAAQCALCHGTDGSGGTGPSLRVRVLRHAGDDAALREVIREGIPDTAMPSFVWAFSDRSIRQVAAYVRSLGRIAPARIPGDRARGLAIYQKSECAACHTIAGAGGIVGPDLSGIGAARGLAALRESLLDPGAAHAPEYRVAAVTEGDAPASRGIVLDEDVFWIHLRDASGAVRTFRKTDRLHIDREGNASLMPSYRSRFNDPEIDDLVAYLASLRRTR